MKIVTCFKHFIYQTCEIILICCLKENVNDWEQTTRLPIKKGLARLGKAFYEKFLIKCFELSHVL